MVREFAEYIEEIDLLQLPNHRIYLKLMIVGAPSKPFSAITLSPTSCARNMRDRDFVLRLGSPPRDWARDLENSSTSRTFRAADAHYHSARRH
jgi:hypothetical protein